MWVSPSASRFCCPDGQMRKIFSKPARRISACFALSGPGRPALSRIKVPPPIIACEMIRSRAGYSSLADARTMGRQMGFPGHPHAWRAVILACSMVWFGPAPDVSAATLMTPGVSELIRKSAEPFGLFASPLSEGGVRGKMAAASSASSTTKGCSWRFATATANVARHRRPFNSSPSWTMRELARGTRPPRRDQSRDQSCDPADERSGPIRQNRRLELAARHLRPWRRRLRRLRHRKIRRAAPGRNLARRFADRDHARHRSRRGPRGRGRAARRRTG